MKAMIFAAGRGTRMGELTANTPKPLLKVRGRTLIEHNLMQLASAGIQQVVINIAYLGEQISAHLGDGRQLGLDIRYSQEPYPLETGGAIVHALPLLGDAPFVVVNADIWTDYPFATLVQGRLPGDALGHLVMVPNPPHNPAGDFGLAEGQLVDAEPRYTYSGVCLLSPRLVADYPEKREKFPLAEVFRYAMARQQLSGELFAGTWDDIGTPERLAALDAD